MIRLVIGALVTCAALPGAAQMQMSTTPDCSAPEGLVLCATAISLATDLSTQLPRVLDPVLTVTRVTATGPGLSFTTVWAVPADALDAGGTEGLYTRIVPLMEAHVCDDPALRAHLESGGRIMHRVRTTDEAPVASFSLTGCR
jgi:hypothetical protein